MFDMFNKQNVIKYLLMLIIVTSSTYYIPNCSIMNEHAIYIGLLAATTFVLLDRYIPYVVIVQQDKHEYHQR
jgi:hypothetical protein